MSYELFLSSTDGAAMYQQIMDQITARVIAGDWPPGYALPSIRELAAGNKVSVITVKRAYLELEHAGVIVTRQGKGSFVAESQELPKALLREAFQQHFAAMLASAARLGLSHDDIKRLLDENATTTPATAPRGNSP